LDLLSNDRSSLTSSDWRTFSNVLHAFDTFSILPTFHHILKSLSSTPCEIRYDTDDVLETIGSIYTSMRSFISCTPDFQVLSVNEQQSLFERNLHGISSLCSNIYYRDTNFFENAKCYGSFASTYGSQMIDIGKRRIKSLDLDSTLLKFMLLIIAFSSNCFIVNIKDDVHNDSFLNGAFRLYGSQNVYVELLWNYMIYRYGFHETVLRFTRLVVYILDTVKYVSAVYISNEDHHDFVDDVIEQTKEELAISQNNIVPLWGRTLTST
jgi:hypothetical protein